MVNNAPAFIGAPGFLISQALMLSDSEFPVGMENGERGLEWTHRDGSNSDPRVHSPVTKRGLYDTSVNRLTFSYLKRSHSSSCSDMFKEKGSRVQSLGETH